MIPPQTQAYCADMLRRWDYDRHLCLALAPEPAQASLRLLFALACELDSIAFKSREPMLGRIRLQWWRDRIEEAVAVAGAGADAPDSADRGRVGQPILDALPAVLARHALDFAAFDALLSACAVDFDPDPPASPAQIEQELRARTQPLQGLALRVLGAEASPTLVAAVTEIAFASALSQRLLTLPPSLAEAPCHLPQAAPPGPEPPALIEALAERAEAALDQARAYLAESRVPKQVHTLLAPGILAAHALRRLRRHGCNLQASGLRRPQALKPLRIWWGSVRGRF